MSDADSPSNDSQTESAEARVRSYRQRHPEKVSEWNRDYYERNRDRLKQRRVCERDTENSSSE